MELIIVILCALLLVSWFVCYNLFKQNTQLENELIANAKTIDRADNFYNFVMSMMVATLKKLKEVDLKGAFASDDEVGFAFRTIIEIIEHTKHQMQIQGTKDDAEDNTDDDTKN